MRLGPIRREMTAFVRRKATLLQPLKGQEKILLPSECYPHTNIFKVYETLCTLNAALLL